MNAAPSGSFQWSDFPGFESSTPNLYSLGSGASPSSGGSRSQSQSEQSSQSSGNTYYSNPALANNIARAAGGLAQDQAASYSQFVDNPTSSPAYTNVLSGMLAALVPSENASRQSLMDMFRAAGNTASSTFGQKAAGLESDIIRNRQTTASNLLAQLYPAIAQAKYAPIGQSSSLLDALKLQQQQSSSQGTSQSQSAGSGSGSGSAVAPGTDVSGFDVAHSLPFLS